MKNPFASKKNFRVTQTQHSNHLAMDLVTTDKENRNIVATGNGTVTSSRIVTDKSDKTWTYGNYVKIKLMDGTYVLYAHLDKRLVNAGDTVKKGQVIGVMGNTGNSTGPHLHFEHRAADGSTRLSVPEYLGVMNAVDEYVVISEDPEDPAPAPSVKVVNVGDKVMILSGAVYTNGVKVPTKYTMKPLTVGKKADGRSLISELNSWIADAYLAKVGSNSSPASVLKVGGKAKILSGAIYTNGVKVPSSCIGVAYTVQKLDNKKALLMEIESWVERKYLTAV